MFNAEEDQTITLYNQVDFILLSTGAEWHLDRITKKNLPLDEKWLYSEKGSCHVNKSLQINTYIIDTGIDVSHPEFEGRAEWLANFAGDSQDYDGNSHGTHCAGLVGSKNYGSCRDSKLYAVKVLDSRGSGTLSGVIKGIEFVYNHHNNLTKTNENVRSIASMSLGGGYSYALNTAVENCIKNSDTLYFAVAAGNDNDDACNYSPAGAKGVLTVMAMGKDNSKAYFSNFGKCAHIYSPGVQVLSTVPGGGTAIYSGTSMATPILAGVLNHYVDMYPDMNMEQIKKQLLKDSVSDVITKNPTNTPNKMVYLHRD
jgi:cerevisin